jgi:uncharacterized membrane protein
MNTYAILKLLHVVAVIVWLGGALTANVLTWRVAKAGDRQTLATLFGHTALLGRGLIGPAALVTLITGIAMVVTARLDFAALWIQWGFAGVVIHFLFGPLLLRRAGIELQQAAAGQDDSRLATARRRVGRLAAIYLALLLSVVGAMVIKPTL